MAASVEDDNCPIENLTDDALLLIFSLLTTAEKCKIASVCQRFRKLAQDGSLWRYIDLHHLHGNQSQKIAAFLQRYTCQATKYIKLGHVNHTILQIIHGRCPNLLQLSLTMDSGDTDLSLIPTDLVWLYVGLVECDTFRPCRKGVAIKRFSETPLECLEYLNVKGGIIDDMVCERLSGNRALRQLKLDYSALTASVEHQKDILNQVEMLQIHDCRFKSTDAFHNLCDIVGHSCNLKGLELCDPSFQQAVPIGSVSLDNLFQAMSSPCRLVSLSIHGPDFLTFSPDTLIQLLLNAHDLEILSLVYCQDVGDQLLSVIPVGVKNLKVLNLYGIRSITEAGVQFLCDHPTLVALNVGSCFKLQPPAILQVAARIPNLVLLGMSSRGQENQTAHFSSQHPDVIIEFNYDRWIVQVELITQIVSEYEMKRFMH